MKNTWKTPHAGRWASAAGLACLMNLGALSGTAEALGRMPIAPQVEDLLGEEELELLASELRRGAVEETFEELDGLLEELPELFLLQSLRARAHFELGRNDEAWADAEAAFEAALSGSASGAEALSDTARTLAQIAVELGRGGEVLERLERSGEVLRPASDPRDAWALGVLHLSVGGRARARELFQMGAEALAPGAAEAFGIRAWEALLARLAVNAFSDRSNPLHERSSKRTGREGGRRRRARRARGAR